MKLQIEIEQPSAQDAEHTLDLDPRPGGVMRGRSSFVFDGEPLEADWAEVEPGVYSIIFGGKSYTLSVRHDSSTNGRGAMDTVRSVTMAGNTLRLRVCDLRTRRRSATGFTHHGALEIVAPMPGRIVKILAAAGDRIQHHGGLLVIEAMKMQNEIRSPRAGTVVAIHVGEGEGVETGARLVSIE